MRILDGNHLAATQRRLGVTRGHTAGPLPGQSLVVLSVPDSEPRTDTFVGVHKIVRVHGQIISRSDDVTKVVKTTGSVEFAFTVSDSTLVRVNGHRATLRVLNMLANKLARVRFIPYRTGNVALEIAVTV